MSDLAYLWKSRVLFLGFDLDSPPDRDHLSSSWILITDDAVRYEIGKVLSKTRVDLRINSIRTVQGSSGRGRQRISGRGRRPKIFTAWRQVRGRYRRGAKSSRNSCPVGGLIMPATREDTRDRITHDPFEILILCCLVLAAGAVLGPDRRTVSRGVYGAGAGSQGFRHRRIL